MEEWEPERIGLLQEINLCISIFELANFQTWSLGMPWTGLQCRQGPVGENVVFDVFGGRMRETTDWNSKVKNAMPDEATKAPEHGAWI